MFSTLYNKTKFLILAILSILNLGCTVPEEPKIDFDQVNIRLMQELTPKLGGTWELSQVHVNPMAHNRINRLSLRKDSIFLDVATLTILPLVDSPNKPQGPPSREFFGTIERKGSTYPIRFIVWPNPSAYAGKGPQAFLLFSYKFPDGIHVTEPEEQFLEDIGLMNETFSLEITPGQPAMRWVGLNRGIERIDFVKK